MTYELVLLIAVFLGIPLVVIIAVIAFGNNNDDDHGWGA